jgi:DNA (cytosine-5)-methyltransferase 3A
MVNGEERTNHKTMNVLSLFDGMSCGLIAFTELGVPVDRYVAYEIDKYAIQTSKHNFPDVEHMGDVFKADFKQFEGFDMVIGGSPCTYWSIAQSADKREKKASGVGWELFSQFVRALKESKPKYFLYENNKSMSNEIRMSITETFGFEPICINSALVSAQNRQRLYWVGKRNSDGTYSKVDVDQPEDRGILLKDVLDSSYTSLSEKEMDYMVRDHQEHRWSFCQKPAENDKSGCLVANVCKGVPYNVVAEPVVECVSSRGVYCDTGSRSKKSEAGTEQHLEVRGGGKTNALTTVQKDNMAAIGVSMQVAGRKRQEDGSFVRVPEARIDGKSTALTSVEARRLVAERVGALPRPNGELSKSQGMWIYNPNAKSVTLTANGGGMGSKTGLYAIQADNETNTPIYKVENGLIEINDKKYPIKLKDGCYVIRKLTVNECKRLQTVPDWYEFPVSNTQAYKMLGNGWTVSVIIHLLSSILKEENKNVEEH